MYLDRSVTYVPGLYPELHNVRWSSQGVLAPLPLTLRPHNHGVSFDASIRTASGAQVQRRV